MKRFFKILVIAILLLSVLSPTFIYAEGKTDTGENYVYMGGDAFGIKMFSQGLVVVRKESFENKTEVLSPADDAGIKVNDIILSANDKTLNSSHELKECIENSKGEKILLKIKRDEKIIFIELYPKKDINNIYRVGMWVKDSAAGLGTVTFYSEELGAFCGLGHGICESDTQTLIPLSYGDAESADITSVTKSHRGSVGSLNGYFSGEKIGDILDNNNQGVYGTLTCSVSGKKEIQIASREEVEKGEAYIYTTIDSGEPKPYKIKITKIKNNDTDVNMVIKITDEELLNETGGIVQGMSGSPIIQNDKIVGAVTHVLTENVDTGYAIFAETMYENMCSICSQ